MDDKYFNPLSQEEVDRAEAELARERYRDDLSDEIERLRAEVAQEKRWGLEAHERAGGVEERLRQIAKDAYFEGREDERHFQPGDDPDEDWENSDAKRALDGEKVVPDEKP